jgi:hypothetical protein
MTKNERLKAFLAEYLPYVDSRVPTLINMGGCAVFALHLSDQLDKMHIPHTIEALVFDYGEYGEEGAKAAKDEISNLMKLINVGTGSFDMAEGHVAIRVDGALFDSLGSLCDPDGSFRADIPKIKKVISIPKSVLIRQINLGEWLPVFDKSQEPLIKHLLSKMPKAMHHWDPGMYHGDIENKKLSKYTKRVIVDMETRKLSEILSISGMGAMAGEMGIPGIFQLEENTEGRV